jgi:hypothetical protein
MGRVEGGRPSLATERSGMKRDPLTLPRSSDSSPSHSASTRHPLSHTQAWPSHTAMKRDPLSHI